MKLFILFTAIAVSYAEYATYDRYKVYEVVPKGSEDVVLLNLLRKNEHFDFWTDGIAIGYPTTVMVKPDAQSLFVNTLEVNKVSYAVLIDNVQSTVAAERQRQASSTKLEKGRISFTEYQKYEDIQAYLERLAADYPNRARLEVFGYSLEGRPLYLLRIGTGPSINPTILIEGGIHAREWISPAVVLYIINELLESDNDRDLISSVNWVVIPVLNVDGYEYSHTTDRFWRKTRRPGVSCVGVDGNRNFDYQWAGLGTSTNECSEIFVGPSPSSEPEILAFSEVASSVENLSLYLSVHSFGNWLLYPWGWVLDTPDNADELQAVGDIFAEVVASVNGTQYTVGNSASLLYYAAGNSVDWAKQAGARLAYTLELPGGGSGGFDLPADRIIPVCEETWAGILTFYDNVVENAKQEKN